jgi:hypothetical protein
VLVSDVKCLIRCLVSVRFVPLSSFFLFFGFMVRKVEIPEETSKRHMLQKQCGLSCSHYSLQAEGAVFCLSHAAYTKTVVQGESYTTSVVKAQFKETEPLGPAHMWATGCQMVPAGLMLHSCGPASTSHSSAARWYLASHIGHSSVGRRASSGPA